jgi:hypothetical protein
VITYRTLKYAGKFEKSVTVFSGPDGKDETIIMLKGIVDPLPMGNLEMVPRKTVVGDIKTGSENEVGILLKNVGDAPLTVTKVISRKFNTVYFDGSKTGNLTIEAGKTHKVNFKIRPLQRGEFIDIIMIYSDGRNDIGDGYKGVLAGKGE